MAEYNLEALIRLIATPKVGTVRIRRLVDTFGTPDAVLNASYEQLKKVPGIEDAHARSILEGGNENLVSKQLQHLQNKQYKNVTLWDKNYPPRLKNIYDPPVLLFYTGRLSIASNQAIGVVGSRYPSAYGKVATNHICEKLAMKNITIISGFARGVDTIAHRVALDAGMATIAVLGTGLDVVYPAENKKLYASLAEKNLIITEYLFETKPDAANFPKRNRIISGLSLGVVVTEAAQKSGALLTAAYALEQNREVFAVPGPINSAKSMGTNDLIKQGAKLVANVDDITSEIERQLTLPLATPQIAKPNLSNDENAVFKLLENGPLHIDTIAIKANKPVADVLTQLLMLEIKGLVFQQPGKIFIKK